MATNMNGTSAMPTLAASGLETLTKMPITIALGAVFALLAFLALNPRVDPREPPVVKPGIPLVGHIIGLMRYQAQFHINLQRATRQPIATLPMFTGKIYAVWDPYLAAAGLKNKSLSPTPHFLAAAPIISQTGPVTNAILRGSQGEPLVEHMMHDTIPNSLKGAALQRFNRAALDLLALQLTTLAPSSATATPIPNAWLWLRRLLTVATTPALYGIHDPFASNLDALEDALWAFEKDMLKLSLNLPGPLNGAGGRGREALFAALTPYYAAGHDGHASASEFVRRRGAELRAAGVPDRDLARLEIVLPWAALANTVPALFWLFCHVFSRPELVARLRAEVETGLAVKGEHAGGEVTLHVTTAAVESKCPLLMSCYRETLRRTVHQVSTRVVVQDAVLSDRSGREYLLKKGNMVQLVLGAGHSMDEYWGEGVHEFEPERFLAPRKGDGDDGPGSARAMRTAFQPFGGGAHLCPGRNFAFAEMMAVMATLLLAYDIEPLEGDKWELPGFATRSVIDAVTKPAKHGEGLGVRIRRRQGWEGVQWKYEV
jgi:cytochrome P450